MSEPAPPPGRVGPAGRRRTRLAVTAVFLLLGMSMASWAARIPAVKAQLHLANGTLGLVLLGPAVGALVAMPVSGALLARVPPRRVTAVALVPLAGLLALVALASAPWQLFAILLGWGAAAGAVDVAMNTEAARVQTLSGRRMMSGFHACYSIGGLVGAGLGALAAAGGVPVGTDFLVVGLVVLGVGLPAALSFTASAAEAHGAPAPADRTGRVRRLPVCSWALVALAVVSCCSFLGEGAANDWSAVYLHTSLGASAALAAVGYALFAAGMTVGRLAGDRLADRWGPTRLVRASASTAAVGLGVALLIGHVAAGLAGFAVLGLGLSSVVPLDFTAAAGLGTVGPSVATVTSSGYLGFLVGPPVIGGLADLLGLPRALGLVVVVAGVIAVLAGWLRPRGPAGVAGAAAEALETVG